MIARLPIIAKPNKNGGAKPGVESQYLSKYSIGRAGRLTERQTQGNLWAQSYGSKVV